MRFTKILGTAAFLLFGMSLTSCGQHDEKSKEQGKKQAEEQHKPPSPQATQQPQKAEQKPPQVQEQVQQQPQRSEAQARTWQQQRGWAKQGGGWQGQESWQQTRAQRWSSDHRSWTQRGGYGGYYIPQDRFVVDFGKEHLFRLHTRPVIYQGYPRFEYGGFSFLMLDPWPEYWADNWYDQDDVYIDYDDGYYLYNRSYSQVRLAVTIAL